jgi:2,3-diketo-5-methylthio-1-phosphopentane phosphatase
MSRPEAASAGAILLDIEGTTTPLAFVTDVLFPYARKHLRSHIEEHAGAAGYTELVAALRAEHASAHAGGDVVPGWPDEPQPARLAAVAGFVEWLMDRDRKSTPLKELQGRIWEEGFRRGELVGEVFPDVAPALERWRNDGVYVGIYSSGSALAQRLLFGHSSAGDLTGFLQGYFDTRMGPKVDSDSYRRIASAIGLPAGDVTFLSDVTRELDAARAAGMQVRLVVRPGNTPVPPDHGYMVIRSFEELLVTSIRSACRRP